MKPKVVVIGLDGATFKLIDRWIEELPNIKKLMEEGSYCDLRSTSLPVSPCAWTSFLTGKNPGKHGIYDFLKGKFKGENRKVVSYEAIGTETLIDILDRNEKSFCMFNVPVTYPAPKVRNGVIVSGIPLPEFNKNAVHPPGLYKKIKEKFGKLPYYPKHYNGRNEREYISINMKINEKFYKVMKYLYSQKEFDFFMGVFPNPDFVSHYMWKYMDKTHPDHDSRTDQEIKNGVFKIYKQLDSYIGDFKKILDENTYFILMSDHGFGPTKKTLYINNFLLKESYVKLKKHFWSKFRYFLFGKGISTRKIFEIATKLGLLGASKKSARKENSLVTQILNKVTLSERDIDWSGTKAYSRGNIGQIFFNKNKIKNKEDADRLFHELKRKLMKLRDENGKKIIDNVYKKEDIFWGENLEDFPDLIFHTKKFEYLPKLYFEFGFNRLTKTEKIKTGDHRLNGIFIVSGPEIKNNQKLKEKDIVDLTPTILNLLEVNIPPSIDGSVIT